MTTLNSHPKSWDSFIQGICAKRKLITFRRLWEECLQEEARLVAREEKMGNEDQALTTHTKNNKREHSHHKKEKHHHQNQKITLEDPREIYLILDAILVMRRDIFPEIVPRTKRRRTTRKYIMFTLQRMMNLPRRDPEEAVKILQAMKNMF